MLYWSCVFFVLAIITAVIGFGGLFSLAVAGVAKVLFLLFLVLFIVTLIVGIPPRKTRNF